MNLTDALTIRRIAAAIGCTATIATTGDQLTDDREAHPCDPLPVDEREQQATEAASYAWLEDVVDAKTCDFCGGCGYSMSGFYVEPDDCPVCDGTGVDTRTASEYPLELWIARRNEYLRQVAETRTAENRMRLELDPDTVDGDSIVSDWQDERNSRPFPY